MCFWKKESILETGTRHLFISQKGVPYVSGLTKKTSMLHLIDNLIQRYPNHLFDQRQQRLPKIKKVFVRGNVLRWWQKSRVRKKLDVAGTTGLGTWTLSYTRGFTANTSYLAFTWACYIEAWKYFAIVAIRCAS